MSEKPRILIAGAGIGGLTAALALLRKGFDVEVYEQASELKEAGAGFHCSPNGSRALYELGLRDAIERVAVRGTDREIRLWNTGQVWTMPDHGAASEDRYGTPMLFLHRGDLHAILVQAVRALKPDAIHVGTRCVDFSDDGSGVTLVFQNGATATGDVLIGADGIKSLIRRKIHGDDDPKFTGIVAWRGLIPVERLTPEIARPVTANWIGPTGSITTYPVHMGEVLNFVALVDKQGWQGDSWTEQGTLAECAEDLKGWHDNIQMMVSNIDIPYKWGLFLREPVPLWNGGRVALLGDACHAMLPYLGQGANSAMEDAVVLSRALDAYADDVEQALSVYHQLRYDRVVELVRQSAEQGGRVRKPELGDPATASQYVETQWAKSSVGARYDWIFEYNAHTVSV